MISRLIALVLLVPLPAAAAEPLRLNQVQVIGTHNSYHIAPAPAVMQLIASAGKGRAEGLEYTHRPLPEQFETLGIRQVELDVFADPVGGLFAAPAAYKLLKSQGKDPGPDPNAGGELTRPGLKVLHVQDVDFRSTVPTFAAGLAQIRDWSKAHPTHVPILVLVELKDEANALLRTKPVKFDAEQLDGVDAAIRAAFAPGHLLTPDDVRGPGASLREAVTGRGWPTLDAARGKVMFALDNEGLIRYLYLKGHPGLKGRAMFAAVAEDDPAAAWFKVNEAVKDFDRTQRLVKAGFLVRTRADVDTAEARANDPTRRDKALASGAHFISTDYPEPRAGWSPYCVKLPGGAVARVNPVNGMGLTVRDWEPKP
jgi:hypothetical protein